MRHLGDITTLRGNAVPITDCVIGGSPCQNLSVAGNREGLAGSESGLFMEQIRIVKEMREYDRRCNGRTDESVRPRYMVWENVPGAFSSNKGEDFRVVLEEVAGISEEGVVIPRPEKGKWSNSGAIIGDGYSIAWRVFDAQHWGVPQRRRRICLVADFNGYNAADIVFSQLEHIGSSCGEDRELSDRHLGAECRSEVQPESESLSGHPQQSEQTGQETSSDASGGVGTGGVPLTVALEGNGQRPSHKGDGYSVTDKSYTLNTAEVHGVAYSLEPGIAQREGGHIYEDVRGTIRSNAGDNQMSVIFDARGNGDGNTSPTMTGDHNNRITDYTGVVVMDRSAYNQGANAQYDFFADQVQFSPPIIAKGPGAVCYPSLQDKTGSLMASGYEKLGTQEAQNDMFIVEDHTACSVHGDKAGTLDASYYKGCGMRSGVERDVVCYWDGSQTAGTLTRNNANGGQRMPDKENFNCLVQAVDLWNGTESDVNGTLQSDCFRNNHSNNVIRTNYVVRRLTPLECERLQGYPDGWTLIDDFVNTKGKKAKCSDAARYKALGNSIALPSWRYVLKRLCANYERPATMASLFDGIGGFPLIWEQINGKGTCLWASEIEEFPMAVTKERFK